MRPLGLLPLLGLAVAAPVLRLSGEVEGPLVLSAPGLVVEGEGAVLRGKEGHTLSLLAPGIRVKDLRVVGAGPEEDFFEPHAAIYLKGCEACLLEGVEVEGAPTAVRVEDSPKARIRGLRAQGLGHSPGVLVYRSPEAVVEASALTGYMDAVYVEYSPGMRIQGNLLEKNGRYGFHVMFSWEARVEANLSRENAVGNAVMHGAANLVAKNQLLDHKTPIGYGLLVQDEQGTRVEANLFLGNTLGLVLLDAKGVAVRANRFLENGTALRITRERGENSAEVLENAFSGNLYDLLVDDPQAKARVRGNAYDRAPGLPVPHLPTSSFALLLARQPELSLLALSPGVVLWESAEAQVPGLRLLSLADPEPRPLPKETKPSLAPLLLGLGGGLLWWRWRR
ncbi:NosD domain-containing protein [Thermus sp.]